MSKETQSFGMTEFQVMRWAEARGIYEHGTAEGQAKKTVEEANELLDAVQRKSIPEIKDAIGDVMVTLVNVAALTDLDVRQCFYEAYLEIKDRKGYLTPEGVFVKES